MKIKNTHSQGKKYYSLITIELQKKWLPFSFFWYDIGNKSDFVLLLTPSNKTFFGWKNKKNNILKTVTFHLYISDFVLSSLILPWGLFRWSTFSFQICFYTFLLLFTKDFLNMLTQQFNILLITKIEFFGLNKTGLKVLS